MDSNEVVNSRVCIGEHCVRTCMYVAKNIKVEHVYTFTYRCCTLSALNSSAGKAVHAPDPGHMVHLHPCDHAHHKHSHNNVTCHVLWYYTWPPLLRANVWWPPHATLTTAISSSGPSILWGDERYWPLVTANPWPNCPYPLCPQLKISPLDVTATTCGPLP